MATFVSPISTSVYRPGPNEVQSRAALSYNINKFPADIASNERHGGNFCAFYINVRSNSKGAPSNNQTTLNLVGTPRSQQGNTGTRLGGSQNTAQFGTIKRTNQAIFTHYPHQISLDSTMDYETPELGFFGSVAANGLPSMEELAVEGVKTTIDSMGAIINLLGASKGGAIGNVLQVAGQNSGNASSTLLNIAKSVSGITLNPHLEVLFKGPKLRTFKMSFEWYPRSEKEAASIREIVNLFRFHMHPELLSPGGAARSFIFPSEFDIYFYHTKTDTGEVLENPWLFVLSSCALTNIKVDYTAAGMWTAHANGEPVGVKVELSFQELEIMTKERLAELEFKPLGSLNPNTIAPFLGGGQP